MAEQLNERPVGQRMTSQRRLLFDLIREADGHLNADELFRRAKEKDSKISLSTVYRNLQLFKQEGLVKERHFLDEHHHYETEGTEDHCHLVCRGCGAVIEAEIPLMSHMKQIVEDDNGFQITDIELNVQGYCARCRSEDGSPKN